MGYFIFGETAFHHEGDFQYMLEMIELAAEVGMHGVKIQVLIEPHQFISTYHGGYSAVNSWIFSEEQWEEIISYIKSFNLNVIAMPCDIGSLNFMDSLGIIDYYDVHSVNFNDEELISRLKETGVPIILSCGGRTLEEVFMKCEFFKEQIDTLMLGFQAFPSNIEDVNLNRIKIYKDLFKEYNIGYADHTSFDNDYTIRGIEYAYILGANVFEKHITLNEGLKRTDYNSAVGKVKILDIIKRLNILDAIFKKGYYYQSSMMNEHELNYRKREKKVVAGKQISKDEIITADNVTLKLTDDKEGYSSVKDVVGIVSKRDYKKDEIIP